MSGPLPGFNYPLLAGGIALAISWLLTPLVRTLAISKGAVDDPKRDDRRIHKEPLPRWGGLAIYAGIALAVSIVLPFAFPKTNPFPMYVIGMLVVGAILVLAGALDDLYQYSAKIQLLVLLAAGFGIQFLTGPICQVQIKTIGIPLTNPAQHIALGGFAMVATAFYIFIITKTMDTIDGVDGLAAGIASIAAGTLALIAVYGGQPRVANVAAAIPGSPPGFLKQHYNTAK